MKSFNEACERLGDLAGNYTDLMECEMNLCHAHISHICICTLKPLYWTTCMWLSKRVAKS